MIWVAIVTKILALIGPELRNALKEAIVKWEASAKETPGPVDDLLVAIVKAALGM